MWYGTLELGGGLDFLLGDAKRFAVVDVEIHLADNVADNVVGLHKEGLLVNLMDMGRGSFGEGTYALDVGDALGLVSGQGVGASKVHLAN